MKPQASRSRGRRNQAQELLPSIFAGLFGAFLGLALLKFGNPPITEKWVTAPAKFWEFLLGYPWPIAWAYWLLVSGRGWPGWRLRGGSRLRPGGWSRCRWSGWFGNSSPARSRSIAELTALTLEALRRVRAVFLSRLFLAEPGAAGRAVLGWVCCAASLLVLAVGLGAALRRPEGVAPLLLSLRLSPHEGSAAGVSEEDLQRPHLRDALLSQRPGRGAAAAAAGHAGGAVATARAPDRRRPVVPDGGGRESPGWPACTGPGPKAGGC